MDVKELFEQWYWYEIDIDSNIIGQGNYLGDTKIAYDAFYAGFQAGVAQTLPNSKESLPKQG